MSKSHFCRIFHNTQTRENLDQNNSENCQVLYTRSRIPNRSPYKI